MPQIVCNIALDVSVNNAGQMLMAKQGDSQCRLLCVRFTDCGKPLNIEREATVLLNVARGEETCAFEGSVTPDGAALFTVPDFALQEAGRVSCDVSAVMPANGRLTTSRFEIVVEEAVCPNGDLGTVGTSDMAAEFIAQQQLYTLTPIPNADGYALRPSLNRRYRLDLSDAAYKTESAWAALTLELPTPTAPDRENWVLIYCHAPVHAIAGAVTVNWGEERLFADGTKPSVTLEDFDIICTYSPEAARWQIGVVQYSAGEGTV